MLPLRISNSPTFIHCTNDAPERITRAHYEGKYLCVVNASTRTYAHARHARTGSLRYTSFPVRSRVLRSFPRGRRSLPPRRRLSGERIDAFPRHASIPSIPLTKRPRTADVPLENREVDSNTVDAALRWKTRPTLVALFLERASLQPTPQASSEKTNRARLISRNA